MQLPLVLYKALFAFGQAATPVVSQAVETQEQSSVLVILKTFIILFITSFIPATAYTFFRYRLRKKQAEFERVLNMMGIQGNDRSKHLPSIKAEYTPIDYLMPVTFCTFTVLLAMTLLMFGGVMYEMGSHQTNNLLLSGGKFVVGGEEAFQREKLSIIVVTIAFMGAFIWSSQNIIRRLITADLSPGTYYNSGIRMIMAALIALMISFILPTDGDQSYTRDMMVVGSFLIGMFPERGLLYLMERVKFLNKPSPHDSHPLPLEMIEGISLFHKVRLAEVGIDNAQNLAETNVIILMIRTPFNTRKLLDWVSQAKLAVYMKEDLFRLTHEGIRTIFDLMVVGKEEGALAELAERAGISELRLRNVYSRAVSDESLQRLLQFQDRLNVLNEYNTGSS